MQDLTSVCGNKVRDNSFAESQILQPDFLKEKTVSDLIPLFYFSECSRLALISSSMLFPISIYDIYIYIMAIYYWLINTDKFSWTMQESKIQDGKEKKVSLLFLLGRKSLKPNLVKCNPGLINLKISNDSWGKKRNQE